MKFPVQILKTKEFMAILAQHLKAWILNQTEHSSLNFLQMYPLGLHEASVPDLVRWRFIDS